MRFQQYGTVANYREGFKVVFDTLSNPVTLRWGTNITRLYRLLCFDSDKYNKLVETPWKTEFTVVKRLNRTLN